MYQNKVFDVIYAIQALTKHYGALCVEIANIEEIPNRDGQLRGYIVDIVFTGSAIESLELSFYVEQD